ncbi:MAG: DUF1800 domain-containing protein [Limisphaerales bacterium]
MLNPLPHSKWNYATAAHLANRAGFGGKPAEIEHLVKIGPDKAVDSFVDYEQVLDKTAVPEWANRNESDQKERFAELRKIQMEEKEPNLSDDKKYELAERRQKLNRERQREQVTHLLEMRGDWLSRMASTQRPLQEKLTLFWHGHFATSAQKVQRANFMWRQIQTFRENASGNWLKMLEAVAKDPAMLIWLDQAQSRREHPNENFAREVMELFALGEGHYTEKDVTEAARALTGFTLNPGEGQFIYRPFMHDNGTKTVLGKTGNLDGNDVLEIIASQPQTFRFISGKLWKFFASDTPDPKLIQGLADVLQKNDGNFKPLLRTMFRSHEFYAPEVVRSQVKSPVQWLVGSIRLLEREMPPPVVAGQITKSMGQDLLVPPNVKGWDGGLSWITTNNLLTRYNQSALLVMAENKMAPEGQGIQRMISQRAAMAANRMHAVEVDKIVSESDRDDKGKLLASLEKRFLQAKLSKKQHDVLQDFLDSRGALNDDDVRHAIRLIMSTPEYQLT